MFFIEDTRRTETRMMLISEKITLPFSSAQLMRPRLLAALEKSLECCAATIVSGRAGSGKTVLAHSFARTCGRPVAWYKVDASDLELPVFLRYLVASIAEQQPSFGARTMAALNLGSEDLMEEFIYELLEYDGEPLLIVLEDLHQICEGQWLVPFLCRVLPLLPRTVHILITSRTLPPAPLWRMRSKQTLTVIDELTLAFTLAEAIELFDAYGLAGELARAAFDRSRGRAGSLVAYAATLSATDTVEAKYFSAPHATTIHPTRDV
jgi:LuxR family transcriptional regulator, maltose regulon positive regulatory protein